MLFALFLIVFYAGLYVVGSTYKPTIKKRHFISIGALNNYKKCNFLYCWLKLQSVYIMHFISVNASINDESDAFCTCWFVIQY